MRRLNEFLRKATTFTNARAIHLNSFSKISTREITTQKVSITHIKNVPNFAGYGTIYVDHVAEQVRLEKWPKPAWREVEDGISGGTTEGTFTLEWTSIGAHKACNSGVKDGDYLFAWSSAEKAIKPQTSVDYNDYTNATTRSIFCREEINYHACGSQLFFCSDTPFLLLLAKLPDDRFPDDITPRDFKAFYVPESTGVNVNSYIWHAPPISLPPWFLRTKGTKIPTKTNMLTKQSKVHSKIYYDPYKEHNTVLEICWTDEEALQLQS
jgi:hypothetical protein